MKYASGICVEEGDRLLVINEGVIQQGIINAVVRPASHAATKWSLPRGGVVINCYGLGLLTFENLASERYISFVSRKLG